MRSFFRQRIASFGYAFKGFRWLLEGEVHGRFHVGFGIFVGLAGWYFELSRVEWYVVILCMAVVIAAEMFNSAIEGLVDWLSPEYDTRAGRIKDLAAGAVLACAIGAALIGALIFLPKVWCWLTSCG